MRARVLTSACWLSLVCLLAVSACESSSPTMPVLDPQTGPSLSAAARPFHFTFSGFANPQFTGPCNAVNIESGTGIAQHLGKVTWESREDVTFCVDPTDPSLADVTGEIVLTAANGDQLTATYTARVDADFEGSSLSGAGDFTVTGGTGRFADATGSGTLEVAGSLLPPFEVEGSFTGDIRY